MNNNDKLTMALKLMRERRHDTVGLGMPITLIEEVLLSLEKQEGHKVSGYLFNGKFYADLSELNGVTMSEGNHPVPLYTREK